MSFIINFDTTSANTNVDTLKGKIKEISKEANEASKNLKSIVDVLDKSGKAYTKLKTQLSEARKAIKELEAANKSAYDAGQKNAEQIKKQAKAYEDLTKQGSSSLQVVQQNTAITTSNTKSVSEAAKMAEYWVRAQKLLGVEATTTAVALKSQDAAIRLQVLSASQYYEALRKATNEQKLLGDQLRLTDKSIKSHTQKLLQDQTAVIGTTGKYAQLRLELKKVANGYDLLHKSMSKTKVTSTGHVGVGALLGMSGTRAKSPVSEELTKQVAGSKKLSQGISDVGKSARRAAQETAAFRAGMNAIGTHMGIFTGQTIAVAAVVYTLVASFKAMVMTGVEFTTQMARAIPIMGANASQAERLEAQVLSLGRTTTVTAAEAAGGLEALAMAGLSTGQAMDALGPALTLASIGQIDMYKSADILTNVMNGFRLTSEDIPQIVDNLATAIVSSNSTITQMASALSYVAPVAKAAGGELKEVTAILEVFHNAGIKSTRAGTALRRAYANLLGPTKKVQDTLDALGITTVDANGQLLEMSVIMKKLASAGAITSDIVALFGVRAAPAMLALLHDMKGVSSEFEKFKAGLDASGNSAEELKKKMDNTLGADSKKLVSALDGQAQLLFSNMENGFRSAVQASTAFINSISPKTIKTIAEVFGALGLAVEIMAKGFGILLTTAVSFIDVIYQMGKAMLTLDPSGVGQAFKTYGENLKDIVGINDKLAAGTVKVTEAEKERLKVQDAITAKIKSAKAFGALPDSETLDRGRAGNEVAAKIKLLQQEKAIIEGSITKLSSETPINFDVSGIAAYNKAMTALGNEANDNVAFIADANRELKQIEGIGLSDEGVKRIKGTSQALKELYETDVKDQLSSELENLGIALKALDNNADKSAAEIFIGSLSEIEESNDALVSISGKSIDKLLAQLGVLKKDTHGNIIDQKTFLTIHEQLVEAYGNETSALKDLAATRADVNAQLIAINETSDNAIVVGEKYLDKLQRENDKLNGIDTIVRSVTHAKLELATVESLLAAETLRQAGKTEEAAQMQAKAERLGELISLTYELEQRNKALKVSNVSDKAAATDAKTLAKDFKEGKGLSDSDKAQAEYALGVERLDAYAKELEDKSKLDQWYLDAKKQLDQELIESQNEVAFSLAKNMSKTIGDNVAQAITMQQTWEETSQNIKKAIVGGVVGALITQGSQMAANALLHKIFAAETVAIDATVTGAKITGEAAKSSAIAATATAEVAAASTATASLTGLIAGGAAMAAAWGPAAMLVSLATFGTNSVGAIAGIAATSAAMLAATAVTTVASIAGGLATSAFGGSTREIGGPVSAGQSYLVGERGAEVFTPTTAGAITSNADVKRSLGNNDNNGEVHHHYHEVTENTIYANDALSFQQQLSRSKGFLADMNRKESRRLGRA